MRDWREDLQHRPAPERKQAKSPHLCNGMAAMRGRWLNGVYMCTRCKKQVYDTYKSH